MRYTTRLILAGVAVCLLVGCGSFSVEEQAAKRTISVWAHSNSPARDAALTELVETYNQGQSRLAVKLELIPVDRYMDTVTAAAKSEQLPDLLEISPAELHAFISTENLIPLDDILPAGAQAQLLPSIIDQGTSNFRLYAAGPTDNGLALYARPSQLAAAGVRIPTSLSDPWTIDEFGDVLNQLAAHDPDGQVLDLKLNQRGEWYTFAFAPLIWSAGGDLTSIADDATADGLLNGAATRRALQELQTWQQSGLIDPNDDGAAFSAGRVPLAWGVPSDFKQYHAAFGDDLVVLPLPDLGHGAKSTHGDWSWGISKNCRNPGDAASFLTFLLGPTEAARLADVTGAIPGEVANIQQSPLYGPAGPLRLFVDQVEQRAAMPLPRTANYPTVSAAFQTAVEAILAGGNVADTLDLAVEQIDGLRPATSLTPTTDPADGLLE